VTTATSLHFPQPDEIEGYWDWDRIHAPRPLTPLAGDAVIPSGCTGFTAAQHSCGSPLAVRGRIINNYFYACFVPDASFIPPTHDLDEYSKELERLAFGVGERWVNEWEPALASMLRTLRGIDFDSMTDGELEDALEERLNEQVYEWTVHGWINLSLVPATALTEFYKQEVQPEDPNEAWQLIQGYENRSVDASKGLWRLAQVVKASPALLKVFEDQDPRALLGVLEAFDEGRAFLVELGQYLEEFGWRSDGIYEVGDPTWREQPVIPLNTIQGYLRLSEDHNPELALANARQRRDELTEKVRARLTNDSEKLRRFDALMDAARYTLRITEDHSYWIDQMGVAALRRFFLSTGARLVAKGVIDRRDDIFFLYVDELRHALRTGGDQRGPVAQRRAAFEASARIVPPLHLGAPTPFNPDPLFVAIVDKALGLLPAEPSDEPNVITGVAASPGTVQGTARVVRTLEEASKLRHGDIMVCEMTVPPWVPVFATVSGVVADSGGILSHCAIVARELGLPAVVGTHVGTSLIRDGMTLTVDGTKGLVRIDTRSQFSPVTPDRLTQEV
jgi:pyruvate,water dikinase